ncbi:hypothetical protein ABE55_19880 [Bacillus thuringiensis]|uniref:phospholipase D-like domain-containing protein n=1 Tax=Bacillus cereus group TaxID=86661 RepID=UPI000BF60D64|nr:MULTISPECIES: phospholipase D-like domain-containing protein [Bacillus cereus group]MBG9468759.1 hypothetical protein [Bacillus thuringiensis]PES30320.1 hypothetical protein CN496_09435 [Bacillus cereus]PET85000.1 hypothetical protein CN528_06730 [Bacillus cereus]
MNKIHFQNHQQKIFTALLNTKKKLYIAVAWINFNVYKDIFTQLAKKGVIIKIIINDDYNNNRHNECIKFLKEQGIEIKKFRTAYAKNFMHHKFCVIDEQILLIGSFNWSKNANFNFENLLELEDKQLIKQTLLEFNYLWKLTKNNIELHKKNKCRKCNSYKYNLMILNESQFDTEYKIFSICACESEHNELANDHLDKSLYNSIINIMECYDEKIEEVKQYSEQVESLSQEYEYFLEQIVPLNQECDYQLEQIESLNQECNHYLEQIFQQLQIDYPIHGVALLGYDIQSQDGDGEWFANVLWKDRFAYEIEERYYNSFNFI